MRTSQEIVKSTSLLSLITIFSLGFGFLKEIVIANYFGAGEQVDAFLVAAIIPLSAPRILTAVIGVCFIPAYIETRKTNPEQAQNLLNFSLISIIIFFLACAAVFYWQTPGIISMLAPGLDEQSSTLATSLLEVMLPILLFFGLFRLSASLLNAHRSFAAPGLAVMIAPLCIIISVISFQTRLGVLSWALALTIGHALQAALLMAIIIGTGIRFRFRLNLRDPSISAFLANAFPLMCAMGVNMLIVAIDRAMASKLAEGSISALGYADKIFQLPLQVFILSIVTVMFPYASLQFLEKNKKDFKKTIQLTILMAAFVLLPITAGLIVMAQPLVSVLFQRGAFDSLDTIVTSKALIGYASGFFFVALYYILQRIFIVIRKTLFLVGLAVVNVSLKFLLNLMFMKAFGVMGIAIATTLMYTIGSLLMTLLILRFIDGLGVQQILGRLAKMAIAALAMGCGCLLSLRAYLHIVPEITFGTKIVMIAVVTSISLGLYALFVWALKIQEARKLFGLLIQLVPFTKRK